MGGPPNSARIPRTSVGRAEASQKIAKMVVLEGRVQALKVRIGLGFSICLFRKFGFWPRKYRAIVPQYLKRHHNQKPWASDSYKSAMLERIPYSSCCQSCNPSRPEHAKLLKTKHACAYEVDEGNDLNETDLPLHDLNIGCKGVRSTFHQLCKPNGAPRQIFAETIAPKGSM